MGRLAYLVPGELTRGKATQVNPPAQGVLTKLPPLHCANWPLTQAFSPSVHGELAVSVANFWFRDIASRPFCFVKEARRSRSRLLAVAPVAAILAYSWITFSPKAKHEKKAKPTSASACVSHVTLRKDQC